MVLCRIAQVRQLTHDVKSLHIDIPNKSDYIPGQFLVVSVEVDGKIEKRAYSLASAPHWDNVEIVFKLNPAGKVTPVLFAMEEGKEIEVSLPYGVFKLETPLPEKIVFLAGGAGLSPLLSMMRHLEHMKYTGEVVFIYANRTPNDIPYQDELERLRDEFGMKLVYTVDEPGSEWGGEAGHISEEMIKKYCDLRSSFYICGPPQMVGHMVQNLEHLGVDHSHIKREQW